MDSPPPYVIDPDDPRAPPHDVWEQLTQAEQNRLIEMLPAHPPVGVQPIEGDPHRKIRSEALDTLGAFFRRVGRKVYLSSQIAVYYPGYMCFVPDLFAVPDTDTHPRMKWVVDRERRGLDFVLDIHVVGDARDDHERNLERYAALGITEFFLFDRGRLGLRGYRLAEDADAYEPIVPRGGRFASDVLRLDLTVHGGKLRFFHGTAPLLEADELVGQLEAMVDELVKEKAEVERQVAGLQRALGEERDRADRAERVNAKLRAEIARSKAGG